MLLQLHRPDANAVFASAELSYTTRDGRVVQETLQTALNPESDIEFEQRSVQKTVALALLVTGMKDAVLTLSADAEAARKKLDKTIDRARTDQTTLQDNNFATEIELAESLHAIMFP